MWITTTLTIYLGSSINKVGDRDVELAVEQVAFITVGNVWNQSACKNMRICYFRCQYNSVWFEEEKKKVTNTKTAIIMLQGFTNVCKNNKNKVVNQGHRMKLLEQMHQFSWDVVGR